MADKSTLTADELKTLLESVMATGLAVTAAEPHGLWGLLQESFASGKMLAKAKMDTGSNPLIKAVVDDFATSEGRSISRDGMKETLSGKKPAEVKTACIEILGKVDGILSATRRRRRVQKLATPDQPECCRGSDRGWISWYWRRRG
jgi:hypothetical protein